MNGDPATHLPTNEKNTIDEHIKVFFFKWAIKWVAIIGTANILVIAGSLYYVFFTLPDRAYTEAFDAIQKRIIQEYARYSML
jgi:hypothetical protein